MSIIYVGTRKGLFTLDFDGERARVVAHHRPDGPASGAELAHQVASDVSGGARHHGHHPGIVGPRRGDGNHVVTPRLLRRLQRRRDRSIFGAMSTAEENPVIRPIRHFEGARAASAPADRLREIRKRAAGFRDVVETLLTTRMDFQNFDDYWGPTVQGHGGNAAYFAALPEATRARIEAAVRAGYLSGAADGRRSFVSAAWAARGSAP